MHQSQKNNELTEAETISHGKGERGVLCEDL